MTPEIIIALGTALSATIGALLGGRNSLNGFKTRVDARFDNVDLNHARLEKKVDALVKTDGHHEARLHLLEEEKEKAEKVVEGMEDSEREKVS